MKVSELTGDLLDCWVAKCLNPEEKIFNNSDGWTLRWHIKPKKFSSDWAHGGPLIESNQIFMNPPSDVHYNGGPNNGWKSFDYWRATVSARVRTLTPKNEMQEALKVRGVGRGNGETALIAAMRAFVASFYGDEVPDIPA